MSRFEEEIFENVDAGASKTIPRQCSSLRKNGYVLIKNRPCKIVEMTTCKTGKHGSVKVNLVVIDIFTGKKIEDICSPTANMDVPCVIRKEYHLIHILDDYMSLLCDGILKSDIPLPKNEVGKDILDKFNNLSDDSYAIVSVLSALDEEQAVSIRVVTDTISKTCL